MINNMNNNINTVEPLDKLSPNEPTYELYLSRDNMLDLLKGDHNVFSRLDIDIRDDEEFVIEAIRGNHLNYNYISDRLRNDLDFTIKLVKKLNFGIVVELFDEKYRDNEEIMLIGLSKCIAAYRFLSPRLKNNPEFNARLAVIPKTVLGYDYLPAKMIKNKEFQEKLEELKSQEKGQIIKQNIAQNKQEYLLEEQERKIKKRENKTYKVLLSRNNILNLLNTTYGFSRSDMVIRDNAEFAMIAIERRYTNYDYISDRLRNDLDFTLKVVQRIDSGMVAKFFVDKYKDNEEIMFTVLRKSPQAYRFLSPRLKQNPEYNANLIINIGMKCSRYLSNQVKTNPVFIEKLKDNGFSVIYYENLKRAQDISKNQEERKYLKICKKFIETKSSTSTLTVQKFIEQEKINIKDFNSAIDYISKTDKDVYTYIKGILNLNSQKYIHTRESAIAQFINDLNNDIQLTNGEIRKCNIIDFYRYFGRYDLKPVMREFKKFINCPLEPTLVRKLNKFFSENKEGNRINYKQEYEGVQSFLVNGTPVEATLAQKKSVASLMFKNNLPNVRKVYTILLRSCVKGSLESEYEYLLPKPNKDTDEILDDSKNATEDELIRRITDRMEETDTKECMTAKVFAKINDTLWNVNY